MWGTAQCWRIFWFPDFEDFWNPRHEGSFVRWPKPPCPVRLAPIFVLVGGRLLAISQKWRRVNLASDFL